jgi:hypothetical protein
MSWNVALPIAILAIGLAAPLEAQRGWSLDCRDRDDDSWGERYCQIEERTLRPGGTIRVNAHPNGGVTVIGTSDNQVELRARISARARTDERAEAIGREVRLEIDGLEISADGPRLRNRESWWVSFELRVPRTSDLWVRAQNGGIEVEEVHGDIDLETVNGGLSLRALGGDVRAETTNGGVEVELEGTRWEGAGLVVRTTNGGVDLAIPDRYSADLETGTVNGGIDFDFPVQVKGRLTRRISTTLGQGGPPVRVTTTNGGVTVRRS